MYGPHQKDQVLVTLLEMDDGGGGADLKTFFLISITLSKDYPGTVVSPGIEIEAC